MDRRQFAATVISGITVSTMPRVANALVPSTNKKKNNIVFLSDEYFSFYHSPEHMKNRCDLNGRMAEWVEKVKPVWWCSTYSTIYTPNGLYTSMIDVDYWLEFGELTSEEMLALTEESLRTWTYW